MLESNYDSYIQQIMIEAALVQAAAAATATEN